MAPRENAVSYDSWKTINPADEFIGPDPAEETEPDTVYYRTPGMAESFFCYHRCWGCDSGQKPCLHGGYWLCDNPHARND